MEELATALGEEEELATALEEVEELATALEEVEELATALEEVGELVGVLEKLEIDPMANEVGEVDAYREEEDKDVDVGTGGA